LFICFSFCSVCAACGAGGGGGGGGGGGAIEGKMETIFPSIAPPTPRELARRLLPIHFLAVDVEYVYQILCIVAIFHVCQDFLFSLIHKYHISPGSHLLVSRLPTHVIFLCG